MLKSMIEKIASMAAPTTYNVDGHTFASKDLVEVKPAKDHPSKITLSGLDSVVKMVRAEQGEIGRKVFIQVSNYRTVFVFSTYDREYDREYMYTCDADTPDVTFNRFMDHETAIIQLQSLYQPGGDTDYLLKLLSGISKESKVKSSDNGVSQVVESRSGVSLAHDVTITPYVDLTPFRTFLEVDQPTSTFLLRVDDDGRIGLFEADGGVWKLEATRNIAGYFERELEDMIDSGDVVVIR